jgi:hypothetical protein
MSDKKPTIWRVKIREGLVKGTVTKTNGDYLVALTPSGVIAFLNESYPQRAWPEEQIGLPEQTLAAQTAVQSHFHLAYSPQANVTVSSSAEVTNDKLPDRLPDNIVLGVPLWELSTQ